MKKTCEELNEVQEEAATRRHLLESGKIRLIRPTPKTYPEPKESEQQTTKRAQTSAP